MPDAVLALYSTRMHYARCVLLRYNYRLYRAAASVRRWPGRSGARGWCSTTRWPRGGPRTRPGSRTSPMRRCRRADRPQADAGTGVARRGVGGGAPAGPRGPEHGLQELLRVGHGKRKGPKVAPPRFRSRKDRRQAVRFTANSRFRVLGNGRLRLPKIGDVEVRWSRGLPAAPTSVTVIRDAAGRYFASFVVEAGCGAAARDRPGVRDRPRPRPLRGAGRRHQDRRAEVPAARGEETEAGAAGPVPQAERQRQQGQGPREGRAGARPRSRTRGRDFHHKLSTPIIRENQAVYVEDLSVRGLARTRLAKSVHDAGWSAFVVERSTPDHVRGYQGLQRVCRQRRGEGARSSTAARSACGLSGVRHHDAAPGRRAGHDRLPQARPPSG